MFARELICIGRYEGAKGATFPDVKVAMQWSMHHSWSAMTSGASRHI